REEAALGVAQVGDGIERDVRHGLAEHRMEHDQVVDRGARVADGARERVGGLHGEARAVEAVVDGDVARRQRTRRGVLQHLAQGKIRKEADEVGLGCAHAGLMRSMTSAMATVRRAMSACNSSTMRPSTSITPLPVLSGRAKAARILRANATSAAGGANTSLATATWSGWISVLPSKPRRRPCTHSRR